MCQSCNIELVSTTQNLIDQGKLTLRNGYIAKYRHPSSLLHIPQPRIRTGSVQSVGLSVLFRTHGGGIVSILLQKDPESCVLCFDGILGNGRQEHEGDNGTENAHRRTEVEWVLALLNHIGARIIDQVREDVCSDEGTDLATRGCDTVVLSSDGGCGGLGGDETDVVTWADFA
jgi:hypothetical protein